MDKTITTFGGIETEKPKLHHRKNLILLEDVDTQRMQLSNMVSSGEKNYKFFIGYKDNDHKIKALRIMFPKTSAYVKSCDGETKWMYFFIEDDELLEIYNDIWNKVSNKASTIKNF